MTLPGVSTPARAAQISARLMPGFGLAVAYALGYR
jgi:hypothetical protein